MRQLAMGSAEFFGPLTAAAFRTTIDDSGGFKHSRAVGSHMCSSMRRPCADRAERRVICPIARRDDPYLERIRARTQEPNSPSRMFHALAQHSARRRIANAYNY
jgi:transposase